METIDGQNDGVVSPEGISNMKKASPWIKFMAIFGIVIMGIVMIFALIGVFADPIPGLIMLGVLGVMMYAYILFLGMGNALSSYTTSPSQATLDVFFKKLKTWAMILGIFLALYILFIIVLFVVGGELKNQMMSGFRM